MWRGVYPRPVMNPTGKEGQQKNITFGKDPAVGAGPLGMQTAFRKGTLSGRLSLPGWAHVAPARAQVGVRVQKLAWIEV